MIEALDSDANVVDAAAKLLTEHGPRTEDQLVAELRDGGVDLGDYPEETLDAAFDEAVAPVVALSDGRLAWLPAVLAGRTFTHRLAEAEVVHDLLFTSPDLSPVELLLTGDSAQLSDGTQVRTLILPFDTESLGERGVPIDDIADTVLLMLPAGYLSGRGFRPDDVIGLRVTADGVDLIDVPGETEVPADLARAIAAILEQSEPVEADVAVWTVCAEDAGLFRVPAAPLGVALPACGLVIEGDWAAREGFDFGRWRMRLGRDDLMYRYDLSEDESLALLTALSLFEQIAGVFDAAREVEDDPALFSGIFDQVISAGPVTQSGEFRNTMSDALVLLAEPAVAAALFDEATAQAAGRAAPLGLFAEKLEPLMHRSARPALRWLRAKSYELLGEVERAEQTLMDAESLDPDWRLTLADLARFAFDRGDADRALSLLRRAGAPADEPMVHLLEQFEATPRPELGRNDACWCGSGRKYKKCHLNNVQLPLEERARWLYEKARMFLMDESRQEQYAEVAAVRGEYADSDDAVWAAMTDPLVADALLFEGGVFEEFLEDRGVLLPDDERLLAQQWLLVDRSVHEITEVRPGDGVELRDLRTGDVQQVRERTASQSLTAGQLICARVAPTGNTPQIFGGLEPIDLRHRDKLIVLLDSEPDPVELVEFLTRRFAPPVLQNTEGDPLVFCEATLRMDDSVALIEILDKAYDRADPAEPEWLEHATTDGMIRATLRLAGNDLHVDTNSEERHERVLAALTELVPSLTLISESRKPARDTREAASTAASGLGRGSALDPSDPGIAAALEQFVREYEQKWLDESIPALAGATPRQAAADPTRRDDLIKLLDSFPAATEPGAMSPDRLRAALDLPTA